MSEDYRTIITAVGQNKFATAISVGPQVVLSEMAIGDSNGVGYNPDENQAGLVNEVYRAALDSVETLAGGIIACTMTVPIDQGGWHIREGAVYDDVGAFLAVVRLADRYKPLPASGQADELTIKLKMDVGNIGAVTWAIDPDRKDDLSAQIAPDYRSVKTLQNDPPADPAPVAGETWIVGNAPTGAWIGREKHLAEWTGAGWVFQPPIAWFHVGLENRTDMRFDPVVDDWVLWAASGSVAGPIKIAPDATDDTDDKNAVTPSQLPAVIEAVAFPGPGDPPREPSLPQLLATCDRSQVLTYATEVALRWDVIVTDNLPNTTFDGTTITIGAGGDGLYLPLASGFCAPQPSGGMSLYIYVNGGLVLTTGIGNVTSAFLSELIALPIRLVEGDTVEFRAKVAWTGGAPGSSTFDPVSSHMVMTKLSK